MGCWLGLPLLSQDSNSMKQLHWKCPVEKRNPGKFGHNARICSTPWFSFTCCGTVGELLIRSVTQLKYELYYIGTFRIQEMANGEFLDQVRASGEGCTVGGLLIRSVTQGHRTLGGTQELVRLPRGFLWLAGKHSAGWGWLLFKTASQAYQPAGPVSCMTGSPLFTSLTSIQGQSKSCKGLLCYLPSLNDIHANPNQCPNWFDQWDIGLESLTCTRICNSRGQKDIPRTLLYCVIQCVNMS